jgi:hypothetical protein
MNTGPVADAALGTPEDLGAVASSPWPTLVITGVSLFAVAMIWSTVAGWWRISEPAGSAQAETIIAPTSWSAEMSATAASGRVVVIVLVTTPEQEAQANRLAAQAAAEQDAVEPGSFYDWAVCRVETPAQEAELWSDVLPSMGQRQWVQVLDLR